MNRSPLSQKSALIVSLALIGMVVLSPQPAHAQGTFRVVMPVAAFTTPSCGGEVVAFVNGVSIELTHFREDNAAGTHIKNQMAMRGNNGVGAVTGAKYRMFGLSNTESQFKTPPGPITDTQTVTSDVVGAGPENNLLIHATTKMTMNNNGTVTVDFIKFFIECPDGGVLPPPGT